MSGEVPVERVVECISTSPEETRALGEALGRCARAGDVIAFVGELGSGKTLCVGGLARGLGVDPAIYVNSPTFSIMHRYLGRVPLYHIDLYRIDTPDAFLSLGLEEYLEGDGVAAIEWAEHGWGLLPSERLTVRLRQTGPQSRAIEFIPVGDRYHRLIRDLICDVAAAPRCVARSPSGEEASP